MVGQKSTQNFETPILLPEEEKHYDTSESSRKGKLRLKRGSRVIATSRRILIYENGSYKSLFYDKLVSLNVRKGRGLSVLELNLVGGTQVSVKLGSKDVISLFDIISNFTSLSNDARIAYAIGTMDAQKSMLEAKKSIVQEIGSQRVMQYMQEGAESGYEGMQVSQSGNPEKGYVKLEAKNEEGRGTGINFNFVPKAKAAIIDRLTREALYTLSHGMRYGSAMAAGLVYSGMRNAGTTLNATMVNMLKQDLKANMFANAAAIRYVSLNGIVQGVELEGLPMAYANEAHYEADICDFTNNVYEEFGSRLAGLVAEHVVEAERKVETEASHASKAAEPIAVMLRKADHDASKSHETIYVAAAPAVERAKTEQPKPKWDPEEKMLIFKVRKHNSKSRDFAGFSNPHDKD
ncbi:MAG: hypothetical protein M1544_01760 [Candidatus Marsarchaeota archaeon]|nr:hypothetical protein [Candidatus Marsarchaeota archaeon]